MKSRTFSVLASCLLLSACNGQNRGAVSNNATGASTSTQTLPVATYMTSAQTINGSTTLKTLSWNLGSQIVGTSPLPGGGTFTIGVQEVSSSGQPSYQFSNPTVTGGSSAILIQNIGFQLNGQTVPLAAVFTGVNRMVPASPASRMVASTTQVIPVAAFNSTDTVTITFGNLTPTVFNPPTYTQLKSASGVFGANCISCHSSSNPQGGVDLTTYSNLIDVPQAGTFSAVAFNPSDSLIIMRMTNSNGSGYMPQTGPVSGTLIQSVSDWINDGAPNN